MPIEVGLWHIDEGLKAIEFGQLDIESRLEHIFDQDISIASPNWMVVGRQVRTDFPVVRIRERWAQPRVSH